MGEKISIDVDTSDAERKIDELNNKIEDTEDKLVEASENVDKESEKSFNHVVGMMRASYMMISGVAQTFGGDMGQVFSALFSIATSAVATYSAIATAVAASGPAGWIQAGIMTTSLALALINLVTLSEKQTELTRRINGLNMSLHAISSMIGYLPTKNT